MAKPRNLDLISLVEARDRFEKYLRRLAATNGGKPAPHTITTYLRDVDEMIRLTHGQERAADDIEADDIEDALLEITTLPDRRYKHSVKKGPGRGVASRARWVASVRAFFTWAVNRGYVQLSPMEGIAVSAPPRSHARQGLTLKETRTLISYVAANPSRNPQRDYALVSLMAESGARVSELCNLATDDLLRLDSGTWIARIHRSKGRKGRDLPVSDGMAAILRDYIAQERPQALRRRPKGHEDPRTLFTTYNGAAMTPRDVQRMLAKACLNAGVRHGTPHGMRHTALTQMGEAGVPPQTIRDIAGHQSIGTTGLYLDHSNEQNAAALRRSPLVAQVLDA